MNIFRIKSFLMVMCSHIFRFKIPPLSSVGAFIQKDGKILVENLTYRKGYGLPGGMIEWNENIEEGLAREIMEETGLKLIHAKYLFSVKDKVYGIGSVCMYFEVEADLSSPLHDSSEGTLYWLDPKEVVDKMAYKNAAVAVKKYFNII